MDSVMYNVPTPKTKRPDLTRDDRLRIQTLYFDAQFTQAQIALQLNLSLGQVQYALANRLTPQKKRAGRKLLLSTPQRKHLISWVTASKENRRVAWPEIPALLGWDCGIKAIRSAFKKEGYVRCSARAKPPLTEQHKADRLAWAWEHIFWTDEQWDSVLWSDETWVKPGRHTRPRVTRRIGESELYHPDCIEPRYQRKIGWMFWGCISGKYGRHKGLFWEKDWETINEGSYCGIIIPLVLEALQEHPELLFQQDNAKGHSSAFAKAVFDAIRVSPIVWPANSPDLNQIETIWHEMKEYIQKNYPEVHRSYKKLRVVIQEVWESITHATIQALIREMGDRCIEVILADGGYTKY